MGLLIALVIGSLSIIKTMNKLSLAIAAGCIVAILVLLSFHQIIPGVFLLAFGIAIIDYEQCRKYANDPGMRWWIRSFQMLGLAGLLIVLETVCALAMSRSECRVVLEICLPFLMALPVISLAFLLRHVSYQEELHGNIIPVKRQSKISRRHSQALP